MSKKNTVKKCDAQILPNSHDKQLNGMDDLKGAIITNIGMLDPSQLADIIEGGLTIDYTKDGADKRIILGFNELGMWVDWQCIKGRQSEKDVLLEKMAPFMKAYIGHENKVTIRGNAIKLNYVFDVNGVKLEMTLRDLKQIENIAELFQKPEKDVSQIADRLYTWFCCNAPESVLTL